MQELYSVSELANDLGVTPRALRFYEDKGLIAPQRAGNTRVYTHRDRGRLMLILRGKRLGFTLREVREWLDLYEVDPDQSAQMIRLKDKVRKRIDPRGITRDPRSGRTPSRRPTLGASINPRGPITGG
jgi:DNA-binding transcriptional MerR regulator